MFTKTLYAGWLILVLNAKTIEKDFLSDAF